MHQQPGAALVFADRELLLDAYSLLRTLCTVTLLRIMYIIRHEYRIRSLMQPLVGWLQLAWCNTLTWVYVVATFLQDLEEQKRTKYKINGTATTATLPPGNLLTWLQQALYRTYSFVPGGGCTPPHSNPQARGDTTAAAGTGHQQCRHRQ